MQSLISANLTIFEGPDGSGKSTAAKQYAKETGARYVHFPALPRVGTNLARMYVEAMLPALLGYQNVVFDRSWLSEVPYGIAFRGGKDRLGHAARRMLERLALRCRAVVVQCDPGWYAVQANFCERKHLEMLDSTSQLLTVYELYQAQTTALPRVFYNYQLDDGSYHSCISRKADTNSRSKGHSLDQASAGNLGGPIVLVGEAFGERKDNDAFYQWPFASFSKGGCSQWLTEQLDSINITEDKLFWINADQNLEVLYDDSFFGSKIFALGDKAYKELYNLKIPAIGVPHPQYWKRFKGDEPYPLLEHLRSM